MRLRLERINSPLGALLVVADDDGILRALDFHDFETRLHRLLRLHYGPVTIIETGVDPRIGQSLARYFAGETTALAALPTATGGTAFQRSIWAALRTIPAGETRGYGALAALLGRPTASRAVGTANGANPIGIVVPCHRVVGADGRLTGYAGGLERKRWLLDHERRAA
jgi:O-6-methylguanine DNA methyltransferase